MDGAVFAEDGLLRHLGVADAEEDALGVGGRLGRRGISRAAFFLGREGRAFSPLFDQSATSCPARSRLRAMG